MTAYYNENKPYAAQWLRNLISAGLIAPGEVDDRSIEDVKADDLKGFIQCHFFAGIGGWSYALRLAGWPDERPVWTGSCPCQPFSAAGQRKGTADKRHLWPQFQRLIAECEPSIVFGEQVASRDGRKWFAGVRADLEALAYGVGGADLCAAGVEAPHIRQRLFWVADALRGGARHAPGQGLGAQATAQGSFGGGLEHASGDGREQRRSEPVRRGAESGCLSGRLGNATSEQAWDARFPWRQSDTVECEDGKSRRIEPGTFPLAHGIPKRVDKLRGYGNAIVPQVAAAFIEAYLAAVSDLAHSHAA